MKAEIRKEKETIYIAPEGRLDTVNSASLREQIDELGAGGVDIALDFSGVDYISSAGLRLLVALKKIADENGKDMVIRNPGKIVREIFKVAGFEKAFTII